MSQENVEILRAFYEAFNTRRVDEALQYVDQNVELHPGVIAPDSDACRSAGAAGVLFADRHRTLGDGGRGSATGDRD